MVSFANVLADRGLLEPERVARLSRAQAESGDSLVRSIEKLALLEPSALAAEISRHYRIPLLEDSEWPKTFVLTDRLSPTFLREHRLFPVRIEEDGTLVLAAADPEDTQAIIAVEVAAEAPVSLRIAPGQDILAAIDRLSAEKVEAVGRPVETSADGEDEDVEHLKDLALDAPVIDLVNRLLLDAVVSRATDLHLEPTRGRYLLRKRVDGMLREAGSLIPAMGRAAVSRVKILSRLNIAERRLPQDGRARIRINDRDFDLRVATMPTVNGEGAAVRFLSSANQVPELGRLGLNERDEARLRSEITAPHGLIVVTGPTGSGKTTTLAAVLSILNEPFRKIVTVEDPVEYQIDGITQVQVKPDIGITFASALRSFLRYDPDVMMVGEMRDTETARIAIHAALTGHLVLSTLHTNSAAGAVSRLLDMGVQGFLLASSLRCVVAQRLVRMLCPSCRKPGRDVPKLPAEAMNEAGYEPGREIALWKAGGCERCGHTGYYGRAAIFELLHVDEDIQRLIRPDVSTNEVAATARKAGMTTMVADGLTKCQAGITTVEEIARVALDA
jgi:general secretion pathway protein E